ncbi:Fe(3+) ABC transporter substrate-binding protein [Chitinimonas sp.]|uniref:Fe(3+) ABC transporter substrate-binding protein n=1 Tax=Chitinimonas sp. TaxID=1934313 RepID=UPI002F956EF3
MKFRPLLIAAALTAAAPAFAEEVTVYSARIEALIKPLFDAFTKETGVQVRFVTGQEGPLMERLKAEGANTPADMLLTVDAGNLWQAEQQGLLKPVKSAVLDANVPAHLRDPGGYWYGMSIRARTIFYNTKKVKPSDLSSYEDLASPKWKNRLCLRTAKKVYNQSLVGTMIVRLGEQKTESIVRGWVNNLAADPFSDDESMLKAIGAGLCDVGIANTYYYGRVMQRDPKLPIGIFWANQQSSGTHVNISGVGVTRYAKNEKGALRLMEWLSSEKAQNLYADQNMEFPVNPKVKPDARVAAWGDFKHDYVNVAKAGELQATAVKLMDRAGYR